MRVDGVEVRGREIERERERERERAAGGTALAERMVGSSSGGGCTPGIVSNRRVHVHTSIWHIDKAS